jgi:hypothetical protein
MFLLAEICPSISIRFFRFGRRQYLPARPKPASPRRVMLLKLGMDIAQSTVAKYI